MNSHLKTLIILLMVLIPALYFGIGNRPLYKIQEVRVAETAREMVVNQDWILPRLNGELRLQKPPLPYWLTAVSYQLFGVSEASARLPSICFGLGTAILLFFWIQSATSLTTAANVALIVLTTFIGLRYSRSGEADVTLMFFITFSSFFGYRLLQEQASFRAATWFYLGLGLGFLTKGPAAVAIPLFTLISAAFILKRRATLRYLLNPLGLLLFVLVAFGWYIWIFWRMPEVAQQFMAKQVDETFITGTHVKPLWWYLQHMIDFFAPWSLLLLPAGIWSYKRRKLTFYALPQVAQYGVIWFAVVFILLTFTVNKQVQYALLFSPPLAILLGHYLDSASGTYARFNRIILGLCCLGVLGLLGYIWQKQTAFEWFSLFLLGLLILAFALRRVFALKAPSVLVLLLAGLTALAYVYGELNLPSDAEKTDAPTLIAQYRDIDTLYQGVPADGALSYYAGRIIVPLKKDEILTKLHQQGELMLITKETPEIEGVVAQLQQTVGQLTLWKLSLQP